MVRKWILLLGAFFFFSVSVSFPALAEEQTLQADNAKTQIAVDEESGTVSIIINGKEVATFYEEGLHVWGNASYNGTIADGTPVKLQEGKKNEE